MKANHVLDITKRNSSPFSREYYALIPTLLLCWKAPLVAATSLPLSLIDYLFRLVLCSPFLHIITTLRRSDSPSAMLPFLQDDC